MGTTNETSHASHSRKRTSWDQRIFKGRRERTGRRTNGGALPVRRASRRLDRPRPDATPSTRDDNSHRGSRRRLRWPESKSRRRPGTGSVPSVREYRPDSLSPRPRFPWGSGSTYPRAIAVDAEPSSTSAFQGLVRIVATTTKIGTGGRSGPARARTFSTAAAAPSYSQPDRWDFGCDGAWVRRLNALHFQGRSLR